MKRLIAAIIAWCTTFMLYPSCNNSCHCAHTSKTYFSVHQLFASASPERTAIWSTHQDTKAGLIGTLQLTGFGGKSTNGSELGTYFFPFCKHTLNVSELNLANPVNTVFAQHFNIFTKNGNFSSIISIEPEQSTGGLGIEYRQGYIYDRHHGPWGSIAFPLVFVRNDLNFCEKILNDGGGPDFDADVNVVPNMKAAFTQKEWKFGKIPCEPLSQTKVADVEIKGGYEWNHMDCHIEGYFGVLIPTGNTPTAEYIFEPIVGRGRHFGIILGSAGAIKIFESNRTTLHAQYAFNNEYLFQKKQVRSFDLYGKPWSRYMEVYVNETQAQLAATNADSNLATPGINVFTQDVKVTPGLSHTTHAALLLSSGHHFQAQLGYNLYCRQQECVELDCSWQKGPALKHRDGEGQTTRLRDITGNADLEAIPPFAVADYQMALIKEEDLNLQSASHPASSSHTAYGAITYHIRHASFTTGASYEFSPKSNANLDRWLLWATLEVSF